MPMIGLNLALRGEETQWETCPNCGLLFETDTKKIERAPTMQFNLTVTGDVTPDIAPCFAQLLTGGANPASVVRQQGEAPTQPPATTTPTSSAPEPAKAEPAPADEPTAAADDDEEDLSTLNDEEFKAKIRERCVALKKAGKKQIILDAYAALGVNHLDKVNPEDYPKLWEVLNDAG